jgi:tetratricopeptide (TPR) repeat protein
MVFDTHVVIEMSIDKKTIEDANKSFLAGDYISALKKYEELIKVEPNNSILWNNLGLVFLKLGKLNDAIKSFEKANELKPNATLALYHKCLILMQLGKYDDASECCDKIILAKPNFNAAKVLKQKIDFIIAENAKTKISDDGNNDESEEYYEEVVEYHCPECDALISENDTECKKCGAKFTNEQSNEIRDMHNTHNTLQRPSLFH